MKEIFEQIYNIFDHMIQLHDNSPPAIRNKMGKLRKMIDEFSEADLTPREKKAAEEIIGRCE